MSRSGYRADSTILNSRRMRTSKPAQSADEFTIFASYFERGKQFYGKLRVARTTDKRVIYPCDGAGELGPYTSAPAAVAAAQALAERLVMSDLANPES